MQGLAEPLAVGHDDLHPAGLGDPLRGGPGLVVGGPGGSQVGPGHPMFQGGGRMGPLGGGGGVGGPGIRFDPIGAPPNYAMHVNSPTVQRQRSSKALPRLARALGFPRYIKLCRSLHVLTSAFVLLRPHLYRHLPCPCLVCVDCDVFMQHQTACQARIQTTLPQKIAKQKRGTTLARPRASSTQAAAVAAPAAGEGLEGRLARLGAVAERWAGLRGGVEAAAAALEAAWAASVA